MNNNTTKNVVIVLLLAGLLVAGFFLAQPRTTTFDLGGGFNRFTSATNSTVEALTSTSTEILAANTARIYASVQNTDAEVVWCALGAQATADNGILLLASGAIGSVYEITPDNLFVGAVNCISITASSTMATIEK